MKKYLSVLLVAVLLLSGCGRFVYINPEPMAHITYAAADGTPLTDGELAHTAAIMEQRLTAIAITDYKISPNPEQGTLEVDIPRSRYAGHMETVAEEWGGMGELSICIDEDGGDPPIPPEGVVLDNSHVTAAEAVTVQGEFAVKLTFTAEGAEILSNTTKRLTAIRGTLPIWMDHEIVSTAAVMQPITGGEALVTGFASWEAAALFAAKVNYGVIPFHLIASVDFSDAGE